MQWITRLIIGLCFIFITLVVSAQESHPVIEFVSGGINDPRVNTSANACYYGGTLSGKCNTTDVNSDKIIADYDRNWMWQAGWHLIRFEYDLVSREEFDPAYISILTPDYIHKIDGRSGCYGVIYDNMLDVYIFWQGGTVVRDVKLFYESSCSTPPLLIIKKVIATETDEQAEAICDATFGEVYVARRFYRSFYQCLYPYHS